MMIGYNNGADDTSKRIPTNSIGAEIGVWRGETSLKFLKRNLKHLYLVDPWSLSPWFDTLTPAEQKETIAKYSRVVSGNTREEFQKYYDSVYESVVRKCSGDNVTILRMSSADFFKQLDQKLDWIYIDGDHSYEGTLFDLESSIEVVRPGGIIFGDDYGNKKEVKQAVDDFIQKHSLSLKVFAKNQFEINL